MFLRASASPRWMKCAASAHFPISRSDDDGDAAREGTCAAWVGELVINGDVASANDMLGQTHENGWTVDADMVKHIQWYADTIMVRDTTHKAEVRIDHPVFPMGGTADHLGWSRDWNTLYIDDLKYGYDIVEPTTWQLICYLFLILANIEPNHWPKLIQLSILQPRAIHNDGPYRKLVVDIAGIQPRLNQMQTRVEALLGGENLATPSDKCLHCTHAFKCTALTRTVYSMWEVLQSREYLNPTPHQLAEELSMVERMDELFTARKNAVQAESEARLNEGGFVPGWSLERRYGKRKFTVDSPVIEMLTGVDPSVDKTCTPAELIRRGANEKVVQTITTTPFIGVKMKRLDADNVATQFDKAKNGL